MTLDELIKVLLEAKEHGVDGRTKVNVFEDYTNTLLDNPKLKGTVWYADYNKQVNLYFEK